MLTYVSQVLQRVSALREQDDAGAACEVLHSLLVVLAAQGGSGGVWGDVAARQLLGETAVLLAIQLLQQGEPAPADRLLSLLGFAHRLAARALQHPSSLPVTAPSQQQQQSPIEAAAGAASPVLRPPAPPPLCWDSPLDPALLAALQHGFRPAAAFWREHSYWEQGGSFFSYVFPLDSPPQHPIEAAIAQLRGQLVAPLGHSAHSTAGGTGATGAVPGGSPGAAGSSTPSREAAGVSPASSELVREMVQHVQRATHAEWWVHCRGSEAPHQLHFDVDETQLRRGVDGYSLRHPLLGSLLFLEADPTRHGATLVLDQTPRDAGLAERGWAVAPAPGRYAAFRGDLLHGVMPGLPSVSGSGELPGNEPLPPQSPRTTLMVAWWQFDAEQERQLGQQQAQQAQHGDEAGVQPGCGSAGPMKLPPWRLPAAGAFSWPAEFASPGEPAPGPAREAASVPAVSLVQPVWEPVGASSKVLGGSPMAGASSESESDDDDGESIDEGSGSRLAEQQPRAGQAVSRLPLLYPPLRFFLFSPADIRAAYVPE